MIKGSKGAYVTTLIGIIFGGILSIWGVINYFVLRPVLESYAGVLAGAGLNAESVLTLSLIYSIIGIALTVVLAFILKKIINKPTKTAYIWVTIIGAIGIFLGLSLGGVVVLIGGIIGIVKTK